MFPQTSVSKGVYSSDVNFGRRLSLDKSYNVLGNHMTPSMEQSCISNFSRALDRRRGGAKN